MRIRALVGLAALSLTAACENDATSSAPPAGSDPPIGAPAPTNPVPTDPVPTNPPATGLTVTVLRAGKGLAGARVIFHDEAGAVVGEPVTTDASGTVTREAAPKQVTVITTPEGPMFTNDREIVTYTGVEDGDQLVVDATSFFRGDAAEGAPSYSVSLPGERPNAVMYRGQVARECGNGLELGQALEIEVTSACLASQNAILSAASDDNSNIIGFSWKKGLAAPTAENTPVTLEAWADPQPFMLTIENLPNNYDGGGYGEAVAIAGSVPFYGRRVDGGEPQSGYGFTMPPAAFADGYQVAYTQSYFPDGAESSAQFGIVKRIAPGASAAIDYATNLPVFTATTLEMTDAHRPTIAWTHERPLTGADAADFGVARFEWTSNVDEDEVRRSWTIVVAGNATSVKAPQLPAADAALSPGHESVVLGSVVLVGVAFGESTLVSSYKDAKKVPVTVHHDFHFLDLAIPLPAPGTLRLTGSSGLWLGMAPPG